MDLLCIGEMVIDFLPGSEPGSYLRHAGGAPANVAIAATRSGLSAAFLGMMGNDDFGRFLVATLEENGVEVVLKKLTDEAVTTMTFVTLGKDGERSFTFVRKPGADMLLTPADVRPEVIEAATIVHIGSCSLSRSPSAEATIEALRLARDRGQARLLRRQLSGAALVARKRRRAKDRRSPAFRRPAQGIRGRGSSGRRCHGACRLPDDAWHRRRRRNARRAWRPLSLRWRNRPRAGTAGRRHRCPPVQATPSGGAFLSHLISVGVRRIGDLSLSLLRDAATYGAAAGSLCVRRKGAIPALPTRAEILNLINKEVA